MASPTASIAKSEPVLSPPDKLTSIALQSVGKPDPSAEMARPATTNVSLVTIIKHKDPAMKDRALPRARKQSRRPENGDAGKHDAQGDERRQAPQRYEKHGMVEGPVELNGHEA
ncbi:hypothetical protein QQZ08_008971 [Neonectria magnoliae]|uniref:Uncharacterized protein n=1 Tax=Neonectria magnoliae TaxID=2732573 RepID=A0ABR1HS19_9HYPO